jgi:hypothetical protein
VCDGQTDCPDASDEGKCNNWNFVLANVEPPCNPVARVADYTTSAQCLRYAIAKNSKSFVVSPTLGCAVYTCLNFEDPQLVFLNDTSAGKELWIEASDPTAFKYCTDALHCSNNGKVLSTSPPCSCSCDVQYIGARCQLQRDMSLIDALYVVFPPAAINASTITRVRTAVSSHVTSSTTAVSASGNIRSSPLSSAVELDITDTETGLQSADIYQLLNQNVTQQIISDLAGHGALFVTATSVVGESVSLQCNKLNVSNASEVSCTRDNGINETKSVEVTIPAVSFTANTQWVEVVLTDTSPGARRATSVVTVRCNDTDFVQTKNPLLDGPCAISNKCTKNLGREGANNIKAIISPDINPTAQMCGDNIVEVTTKVDGFVTLPDSLFDTNVSWALEREGSLLLLVILLGILAGLAFVHLLVWAVWMRKRFQSVRYLGPVASALTFFFGVGAAVSYGLYLDSSVSTWTHTLVIEEYRDHQCGSSEFAFIPSRAAYLPIDAACHALNVIGQSQGVDYVSVRVTNGTNDKAYVQRGSTATECASAAEEVFHFRHCVSQQGFFVDKPLFQQLFMSAVALPNELANHRIAAITAFNPPHLLPNEVTVLAVPAHERFAQREGFHTYTVLKQFVTRASPYLDSLHMVVKNGSDVPLFIADNTTHDAHVRFIADFVTAATVVKGEVTTSIDSHPSRAIGVKQWPQYGYNTTDITDVGTTFNGYGTSGFLADAAAQRDAQRYQYVRGTALDIGWTADTFAPFTLTLWTRMNTDTRGVLWAATDNWQASSGDIPTLSRIMAVIENGATTTPWFSSAEEWDVYSAMYVNGNSKQIHFVYTIGGELHELLWDTKLLGVDRIFDGGWHFLGVQFFEQDYRITAQLFVDGETSFDGEGWRACLKENIPPIRDIAVGTTRNVFNNREEKVKTGGLFVVGHVNAGVYDILVIPGQIAREKLISYGAPGMELYATIAETESYVLGVIMVIIALVIFLKSLYEVWFHYFGVDTNTIVIEEEDEHGVSTGGKKGKERLPKPMTRALVYLHSIPLIIGVAQTTSLYFSGWAWPVPFESTYGGSFGFVSLDFQKIIPSFPSLLAPAIQFIASILAFFMIVILAVRDGDIYATVIEAYKNRHRRADRALTRRLELDRPRPTYTWVVYDEDENATPLTPEQHDFLTRGLHDLLTSTHRKAQNMRLHTKHMMKFPGIGNGILMYERRGGQIAILFRIAQDKGLSDMVDYNDTMEIEQQQSGQLFMRQITFESTAKNVQCPLHERRLLRSDMEGLSCVHNDSPYYRSVSCSEDAVMYQCPEVDCMYAVCADCWTHGGKAVDGALTGALSTLAEVRRKGLWKVFSTLVIVMALIMYLPVTKSAVLIMLCHPSFQCEFGNCISNPDFKFLIAVLLCIITIVVIGIGLIVLFAVLLYRRHISLMTELPMQHILRKTNLRCLPKFIVRRVDFDDFLDFDESMIKTLYEPYEFEFFWFAPMQLAFKALTIVAIVATTPNSLTQLGLVCLFEATYAIVVTWLTPYKNVWIEAVARFSVMHQVIILGLFALHRVDIRQNPHDNGFQNQMILTTAGYFAIVLLILICVLLGPWARKKLETDRYDEDLALELEHQAQQEADAFTAIVPPPEQPQRVEKDDV